MAIKFYTKPGTRLILEQRNKLKEYLANLFTLEQRSLKSLAYVFCSDNELLAINKQFLKHNTYTDIITFTLSAPGQPIEGEIYISIQRVKDNAINFNCAFREELHRVIFHGALHLCGYTDEQAVEKARMRNLEDQHLQQYFG